MAKAVIGDEELPVKSLSIVVVDDDYLRELHGRFLNDDSVTDVMTFDLSDPGSAEVEAEIYISAERAAEHAGRFNVSPQNEMARLLVHGLLHLRGYDDHEEAGRESMRNKEDHYLQKYSALLKE